MSLILQEFNGNTDYTGAVRCIADGTVKQSEIADKLKIDRAACKRILDDLEFVGMVERRTPMGSAPKKPVYSISDPFVSFSFNIIANNIRMIESSSSKSAAYGFLRNDIDSQLGHMFEKLCGNWLDSKYTVVERGQWWGRIDGTDTDIDIVAKVSDGNRIIHTVLGECKFSRKPMGFSAYNKLVSRAKGAGFTENVTFVLFSAEGFEDERSSGGRNPVHRRTRPQKDALDRVLRLEIKPMHRIIIIPERPHRLEDKTKQRKQPAKQDEKNNSLYECADPFHAVDFSVENLCIICT